MPAELEQTEWDVLIIGTGMGGATLGYELAKAGRRVLFVEKGASSLPSSPDALRDGWADSFVKKGMSRDEQQAVLSRGGRFTDELTDASGLFAKPISTLLGSGTGGSSALYGMVLERFFRDDFTPRQNCPDADGSTLPDQWPISYDEFSPWYAKAEELYRVRGSADPLRPDDSVDKLQPPPPLTPGSAELFEHLTQQGMHPYHLHMAIETVPDCQSCVGFLCSRQCKNDAGRICLQPAVCDHNAQLLTDCRVVNIEAGRTAVKEVICDHRGETRRFRSRVVVLAAGALATPALLLRATSPAWPQGLANRSGQVGRNLMRHALELYAIRTHTPKPMSGQTKELSFNDLYHHQGHRLGTVQSFGPLPSFEHIAHKRGLPSALARWLAPLTSHYWSKVSKNRITLCTLLEDYPYAENRVLPGKSKSVNGQSFRMVYRLQASERRRLKLQRAAMKQLFQSYPMLALHSGGDNSLLAHVCGTARFGSDPKTSVLDASNRAHDLDNLYVVDASFFPSSAGINPSLTIAANALRIAAVIHARL